MKRSVIIGTGSCIPDQIVSNKVFENSQFYEADGTNLYKKNKSIIAKFSEIAGIHKRCYATAEQNAPDLKFLAGQNAIGSTGIDAVATVPTLLDLICRKKLVGHEISAGDRILMP
jgi:3-oxoacyl-[acyl-carrier-protein] synthase-3